MVSHMVAYLASAIVTRTGALFPLFGIEFPQSGDKVYLAAVISHGSLQKPKRLYVDAARVGDMISREYD